MSTFRWLLSALMVVAACSQDVTGATPLPERTTPSLRATVFFEESFDQVGWSERGWYDNTNATTTASGTRTGSGRALEWRFSQGATLPAFGGAMRRLFAPTDSLYVAYWVKWSDNWVGSQRNYHPHEILLMTNEDGQWAGPAETRLTTYFEWLVTPSGIVPNFGFQDTRNVDQSRIGENLVGATENRGAHGCNGIGDRYPAADCYRSGALNRNGRWFRGNNTIAFTATTGPRYLGDWHRVEVQLAMNTVVNGTAQTNGVLQVWVDGAPVLDYRDIQIRTGARPNQRWNQILLAPYIGDGSPVTQTQLIDDLIVANHRP